MILMKLNAVASAIISALSGIPVRRDVSMTGEITIRGNVLPIGGLREKTMAAYNAGVRTIIIPADNLKDLHEVDPLVRENVTFIPCRRASEVLTNALVQQDDRAVSIQTDTDIEGALSSPTCSAPATKRASNKK